MKQHRILRESKKNHDSLDKSKFIPVSIENDYGLLPLSASSYNVDEYEQYIKEKDSCNRYRLFITLNPVCSNVLFNRLTEIVYHEGADDCVLINNPGQGISDKDIAEYISTAKGSGFDFTKESLIDDTAFSHPEIGNLSYHCGYDIFSNHFLRNRNFNVVNKNNSPNSDFNTVLDENRYHNGNVVKDYVSTLSKSSGNRYENVIKQSDTHLYMYEDLYSISDSIVNNLHERDGWFGFYNKTNINVSNYEKKSKRKISLNKCINNKKPNENIDMYPDRTLFSFLPKENKFRGRLEYNWDFCLTYPFSATTENFLVSEKDGFNGLKCNMIDSLKNLFTLNGGSVRPDITVSFITPMNNNLSVGDKIRLTFHNGDNRLNTVETEVVSTGYNNNFDNTVFSVNADTISVQLTELKGANDENIRVRVSKIVKGELCRYYIRLFKRLPNFNNTEINTKDLTLKKRDDVDDIVDNYNDSNFNMDVNKLCFSKNIYGDDIAQLVFGEDVDTEGLLDNMNRPLSEIYLTIIKNNRGYDKWYGEHDYNDESVEYSHCFGKLTAGFDLLPTEDDYNVHKIHNIDVDKLGDYKDVMSRHFRLEKSPLNLEDNNGEITSSGDSSFKVNGVFFGDMVEYSPMECEETIIEPVHFRFNTGQREVVDDIFEDFKYTDIKTDDYELADINTSSSINCGFSGQVSKYNEFKVEGIPVSFPFNIQQEGYYYSPHHKITVREFQSEIRQSNHTSVQFKSFEDLGDGLFRFTFSKPYGLCRGDNMYYYNNGVRYDGEIVSDTKGTVVIDIRFDKYPDTFSGKKMFRENKLKPLHAFEMSDNTGRYVWRDLKTEKLYTPDDEMYDTIYTNGRKYLNKLFILFLRRQDAFGSYGFAPTIDDLPTKLKKISVDGVYKDVSKFEYVPEKIEDECGLNIGNYLNNRVNVVKEQLLDDVTDKLKTYKTKYDKWLTEMTGIFVNSNKND